MYTMYPKYIYTDFVTYFSKVYVSVRLHLCQKQRFNTYYVGKDIVEIRFYSHFIFELQKAREEENTSTYIGTYILKY
jgi:hypothetical protein